MGALKPVTATDGSDITVWVADAAAAFQLDPVVLLALLKAESGLNLRAERWGRRTAAAKDAIAFGDLSALQDIIFSEWPDISFGTSQRIVLYHNLGDRTKTAENCLTVREAVFADPAGDIGAAASRLASCFSHPSCDGTPLSAMVVYNAGSDRRADATWLSNWGGNVRSYERALAWAEDYREQAAAEGESDMLTDTENADAWNGLMVLFGCSLKLSRKLPTGQKPLREQQQDAIRTIKAILEARGLHAP